jgi:hypothetical protein
MSEDLTAAQKKAVEEVGRVSRIPMLTDMESKGRTDEKTAKFMEDWARGNKRYFQLPKAKREKVLINGK